MIIHFWLFLYLPSHRYAFFRPVRKRRRWWWCRCHHSPGPPLQHAMSSVVRRQAGGSHPSSKALVSADVTLHRPVDTGKFSWNSHWSLLSLLQVFIMCLTQPLLGLSACLRARKNLWSGFRGRSRTTKVYQWWLQLVQVFQKKLFLKCKVLFFMSVVFCLQTSVSSFLCKDASASSRWW